MSHRFRVCLVCRRRRRKTAKGVYCKDCRRLMNDIQAAHDDGHSTKRWLELLTPAEREAREPRIRGHEQRVAAELRRLEKAHFASAGR